MSAAVISLTDERAHRQAHKPFAAVFQREINTINEHEHRFTTSEWRVLYYSISQLPYGQKMPFNGADLARRLGFTSQTAYRIIKLFLQLGIYYKQKPKHCAMSDLYLSSYIAYRGKLNGLKRMQQLEDMIKAAAVRGEEVDVDLGAEHYYAGGVPDDDSPQLPNWLEDA